MKAQISFDTIEEDDSDDDNYEGCFRVDASGWRIFYFTKWWDSGPEVHLNAVWRSGVCGVQINFPKGEAMTKNVVKKMLGELLGVDEWEEVTGPDSLTLK